MEEEGSCERTCQHANGPFTLLRTVYPLGFGYVGMTSHRHLEYARETPVAGDGNTLSTKPAAGRRHHSLEQSPGKDPDGTLTRPDALGKAGN